MACVIGGSAGCTVASALSASKRPRISPARGAVSFGRACTGGRVLKDERSRAVAGGSSLAMNSLAHALGFRRAPRRWDSFISAAARQERR